MPRDQSCPDATKPHSSIKVFSIAEPSIAWPALVVPSLPTSYFNRGATCKRCHIVFRIEFFDING